MGAGRTLQAIIRYGRSLAPVEDQPAAIRVEFGGHGRPLSSTAGIVSQAVLRTVAPPATERTIRDTHTVQLDSVHGDVVPEKRNGLAVSDQAAIRTGCGGLHPALFADIRGLAAAHL